MTERFSRANVVALLEQMATAHEREHGFKEGDGRAVVTGKDRDTAIAFGRYEALQELLEVWRQ
jgi:hypothetical protein